MPLGRYREPGVRIRAAAALALAGVALLVAYEPAVRGQAIFDDHRLIFENPQVTEICGLWRMWIEPTSTPDYYPLTYTTWWLEQRLWPDAVVPRHVINVLLHAMNAVLAAMILRRLEVPGALLAAAMFALHPVQVESVAWMSQRKSVLSGLFFLLALYGYLRAEGIPAPKRSTGRSESRSRPRWRAISVGCFALALLSKPVTMTLLGVLPLVLWWKRGRVTGGDLRRLGPYAVLALPMATLTVWLQRYHVEATGTGFDLSFLDRLVLAGRVGWFCLWKLMVPLDLNFAYPRWAIDAGQWSQWAWTGSAAVLAAVTWRLRDRLATRAALAAGGFFAILLSPALGFFNVYWHLYYYTADHVQYLACLGPIAAACAVGAGVARRAAGSAQIEESASSKPGVSPAGRAVTWAIGCGIVLALGLLTHRQARLYADESTIWRDVLAKDERSVLALNNLGLVMQGQGRVDEAIRLLERLIAIDPTDAEARYNLGLSYQMKGDSPKAIEQYREKIRLEPNRADARVNLSALLLARGETAEAEAQLLAAIAANPTHAPARCAYGRMLFARGKFDAAAGEFIAATEHVPNYAEAWFWLGLAHDGRQRWDDAIRAYNEVVRLDPSSAQAYRNLGVLYARTGRSSQAQAAWREAERLDPSGASAGSARLPGSP